MSSESESNGELSLLKLGLWLGFLIILAWVLAPWLTNLIHFGDEKITGPVGDSWGGFTALVTALSLVFVAISMVMQSRSLRAQMEEVRYARDEFILARDEYKRSHEVIENQVEAIQEQVSGQENFYKEQVFANSLTLLESTIARMKIQGNEGSACFEAASREADRNNRAHTPSGEVKWDNWSQFYISRVSQAVHMLYAVCRIIEGSGKNISETMVVRTAGLLPRDFKTQLRRLCLVVESGSKSLNPYLISPDEPLVIERVLYAGSEGD